MHYLINNKDTNHNVIFILYNLGISKLKCNQNVEKLLYLFANENKSHVRTYFNLLFINSVSTRHILVVEDKNVLISKNFNFV